MIVPVICLRSKGLQCSPIFGVLLWTVKLISNEVMSWGHMSWGQVHMSWGQVYFLSILSFPLKILLTEVK